MAIHRSVHKAKGAGCGRLPGTVVASGSGGSSASLRKVRPDFIPPPHLELAAGAVIGERAGNGLRKVLRWPLDVTPRRPFEANSFYF